MSNSQNELFKITWIHPHNVFVGLFVESGFFGLFSFLLLLLFFLFEDIYFLKEPVVFVKIIIISFWSLFLFSLVNPATTLDYSVLFWTLRALIHTQKTKKILFV